MDVDRLAEPALYFGPTTGQLWMGREGGCAAAEPHASSWRCGTGDARRRLQTPAPVQLTRRGDALRDGFTGTDRQLSTFTGGVVLNG